LETDHLDHYGTFAGIVDGFDRYLAQVPGPKVLCADDPVCVDLAARHGAVTYGTSAGADYRGVDVRIGAGAQELDVVRRGEPLGRLTVPLRGIYNVRNALGALAMAMELGVEFADAAAALARFGGVARRFDIRGIDGGATLVDDYAHIPGEIAAVLRGARESADGWQRLIAVFQPNRYNRMSVLSPEYRDAFVDADVVVLTDIYPSGTTPIPGVTGKLVVDAVLDAHPRTRMVWLPRREDLVEWLARELRPGDVSISMGCGDVAALPDEVLARRAEMRASAGSGTAAPGDR
jgi:UDP-N-acetylmuramate--alanine ligase